MSVREFGPFWQKKLLSFFRKMNLAGDGRLSRNDYANMAERYIQLGKLDGVKAKQIRRKMVKVWDDFLASDSSSDTIDEATYLQAVKDRGDMQMECCLQFFGLWFDVIDLSGDGFIQTKEFSLFLHVFGVENESDIEDAFKVIDTNGDGKLSYEEFVHIGCEYFISDDESLPSKCIFGPFL